MWRRIAKFLADNSVLSKSSTESLAKNGIKSTFNGVNHNQTQVQTLKDATLELKSVVNELSQGRAQTITKAPSSVLHDWASKSLEELKKEELEEMARAYFDGTPEIEKDFEKAFVLWTEAASRGSTQARYSRALCLREGKGTKVDLTQSFKEMLQLADETDFAIADYAVGLMYAHEIGTELDHEKAFHYFMKSARGGVPPAIHNIANAYAQGKGVEQSDKNAFSYYELAAKSGDAASKFTLANWLFTGKGVSEPDKMRSYQLMREAALAGHPYAMFNLGAIYIEGEVVDKDMKQAAEWFEKAADKNIPEAAINVGKMYAVGEGVARDLKKAHELFSRFAQVNPICKEFAEEIEKQIISEKKS